MTFISLKRVLLAAAAVYTGSVATASCRHADRQRAPAIIPMPTPGNRVGSPTVANDSDGLVALQASASPTVIVGDGPLWLTYVLQNRGNTPVELNLEPMALEIVVLAPSGRPIARTEQEEVPLLGSAAQGKVPAGAFIGRTLNVRCIAWLAGPPVRTSTGDCAFRYDFRDPGEYRMVVRVRLGGAGAGYATEKRVLQSDTVRVQYRPS